MNEFSKDVLSRVVADVLERFAFSFVEDEDNAVEAGGEVLVADLAFSGPVCGAVILGMPRALSLTLGANILGLDPDTVGAEVGEDAVKELCNIICGELLPMLYGSYVVFNLGIPVLRALPATGAGAMPPDATVVRLSAEGFQVVAALTLVQA